jgi:hypothetical protein
MRQARLSRLAMPLLAAAALAFLLAMVVIGAQPKQRQLVTFEAKGVLRLEPDEVGKIVVSRAGRHAQLVRRADGWVLTPDARVTPAVATHLDTALKMLHRSAPVREMAPEDLAGVDTRPFGLEDPTVIAALWGPAGPVLTVRFGAHNPEGFLQYMQIEGNPRVYLMSRFIGAEWLTVAEGVEAQ